jgi:N-acylneuraminate cytidylyltransferase
MINNRRVLAIIPARGGSKGLPRKNILDLGGIPLISWTIRAAQNSKYIDRVILSSDDEEICTVARNYNCEIPFTRPAELATDTADSVSVVSHALESEGQFFDIIVLLQPTSPFRSVNDIDGALEQFICNNASSLVSVTNLSKSVEWLYFLDSDSDKLDKVYQSDKQVIRRQDSRKAYFLNGAIYIFEKQFFIEHKRFIDEYTQAYVMGIESSLDIDTKEDLNYARYMLESSYC